MALLGWRLVDLQTDARRMLQERTESRILNDDLTRWANEGEALVATKTRCLRSTATATTVTAQEAYNAPTSAIGGWAIVRVDYNGKELEKESWEARGLRLSKGVPTTAVSGTPEMWSPYGQQFYLTPPPKEAKTYKVYFAHLPDAMALTGDVLQVPISYGSPIVTFMVYKGLWLLGKRQEALAMWQIFAQQIGIVADKSMPELPAEVSGSAG